MSKIENLKVKEYLIQFVIKTTSKSKLFTSVFGKDFARQRLESNLKTVYTNEFNEDLSGYYSIEDADKSITLCTTQKDAEKLTVAQLRGNKTKLGSALHEAIHALFARTEKECKKYRIKYGTGMSQGTDDGTEFGRGANEGLTNWLCGKLGYNLTSYPIETTLIKQLELAIGEKNVMKMGKGDISGNISRLLKMKPVKTYVFLGIIDEIYKLNKESKHETGELKKETIDRIHELIAKAESKIFDKYFKRKFEAMKYSEKISVKDYEKFKQFKQLLMTKSNNPDLAHFSSSKFLKDFDELTTTFAEYARNTAKEHFKNGQLTLANFTKLVEQTSVLGETETRALIQDVCKMLYPNNADIEILLGYLIENGKLRDAKHYSIRYVENMPILQKDGKPYSSLGFSKTRQLQKSGENTNFINFTLEIDEDYNAIINQFLQLESRVKQNDPKAKITIIDRIIIVESRNRQKSYVIQNGNIVLAKHQSEVPIQFQEDRALIKKKTLWDDIGKKLFGKNNIVPANTQVFTPINKFADFRQKNKCEVNDSEAHMQEVQEETQEQKEYR